MTKDQIINFFILMIALLTVCTTYGQQAVIKLIDARTGEPVPYAHVCFESVNNGQQQHGLTDDNGEIANLSTDKSIVAISFVGYETLFDTLMPGQNETLKFEPAIFNMNEVVVTAQYTPQRVDKSIYKVKVIGAKQIEQKAANNLSDLFADELSIRINQDGALGSSMSIRGLSGENVKFLIDGVPVIGRMNGN
ncbi:MAG: TonB-dependent receptor plug domain-containing protein, partial [Bacteroidales bacterium]|nr:TonB-dependent receptor plug domain-containing protein [Bacteroidales bacterium]